MPAGILGIPQRLGRWIRFALRPPAVSLVHHPDYIKGAVPGLMDPSRPDKVMAFLMDEGLARRHDVSRPLAASLENILRVHSTAYVESLADPTVVGDIMGLELGLRDAQAVLDVARLMVGGTIQATRLALRTGKTAVHLGGGLHHAMPDEGMGFCVFNDVAVAIARLRARGFAEPVLVVDLDLHDGNGTRAAFAHDPTVYTFSIHNTPWDEAEAVASTSLALGSDVTDGVFLDALTETLPPVVAQHRPGLVVYVAGVDGAASDALGDWKLSTDGLLARDRFVVETVRKDDASVPIVAVLAGGYGQSAWRYTARFVAWLITGQAVEPPDAAEIIVRRFRELSRQWQIEETMERDESDWGLTADDLLGLVTREDTRFLGRFSRHAVEFQLEQLGVLDNMRRRGFDELRLSLDAPKGLGQVLRIHGAPDERGLLMELKASRSRSIVPGFEVIEIEWLLLQNPRASFSDRRPQLPGQSHPGLGMLRDMAAWLIVVSEKMRLDGIAFVPSQFYMAAVGRRHLKFVSPEAQGRYEAIREVLKDLSLGSANRALIEGVVVDGESGRPVSWEPVPMVLPVSSRLRAEISSTRYRERAASTRASLQFRRRET